MPWLQVDDLRLTFQYGGLLTPEHHPDLFYFLHLDDVRRVPEEVLCDHLVRIATLMGPAIETVIGHHVATRKPLILEGDGIAPALAARQRSPAVRAVFLIEPDEEALYQNLLARGRGAAEASTPEQEGQRRAWVRLAWHYNLWLEREARRYDLPTVSPQPYDTLPERILQTAS